MKGNRNKVAEFKIQLDIKEKKIPHEGGQITSQVAQSRCGSCTSVLRELRTKPDKVPSNLIQMSLL